MNSIVRTKKTIEEINNLYNKFLSSYVKLSGIFNIDSPIEIYIMYNYLLCNGYLSKDKTFAFSTSFINYDIDQFYLDGYHIGCMIFSGRGVCRHISNMMADLLNNHTSIEAHALVVYMKNYNNIFYDDKKKENKLVAANQYGIFEKIFGNHAICIVKHGKMYTI